MSSDLLLLLEPFQGETWKEVNREAAQAFWGWHRAFRSTEFSPTSTPELVAQIEQGNPIATLPEAIQHAAFAACAKHSVSLALLAEQVEAASQRHAGLRFENATSLRAFADRWVAPHARLLAHLAGLTLRFQQRYIDELAYGFFITRRLVSLPNDVNKNQVYIPLSDLDQAGVSIQDLEAGKQTEAITKVLWKQSVRARDALSQGRTLYNDLDRPYRRTFKRAWLTALEVLDVLNRAHFDVWHLPAELSVKSKLAITLQSIFGRTSFR